MIIIKKRKYRKHLVCIRTIGDVIEIKAVNLIRIMLKDRNKCLLYIKSDNTYVRYMSIFLIQNKDISKYERITLHVVYGSDIIVNMFGKDELILDRFIFKG
jgi:hypothetical protein